MATTGKLIQVTPEELEAILDRLQGENVPNLAIIGANMKRSDDPKKWSSQFLGKLVYQISGQCASLAERVARLGQLQDLLISYVGLNDMGAQTIYMASEITSVADGLPVALPEAHWSHMATMPIDELVTEMRRIVRGIDLKRYRKSIRGPKKPAPKKIHNRRHVHVSAAKILAERH